MKCSVTSVCNKDVISITTGMKLGCVGDVEFDSETGKITSLIIPIKQGFLSLPGKGEDIRIGWCDIEVIGDDTILVKK